MNPLTLTIREIRHRWKSSLLVSVIVAAITGALTYFTVNNAGFQKEVSRNARDIGSNVVILPAEVDQFEYHSAGGFDSATMPYSVVEQLIEYKASLNHLIPMLERQAECNNREHRVTARVVGIAASIPMPGRPKSPMQKAVEEGKVQLGSTVALKLDVQRDETPNIQIAGETFEVSRVNRETGTWQDSVLFMNLDDAQALFELESQISRIEAIECTDEECAATGLKSEEVLTNELARATDAAQLLRRERIADARTSIRNISTGNLNLLQNALWALLALAIIALAGMNSYQRRSEVGVLQALGYGQFRVGMMFVARALLLTFAGAAVGLTAGALLSFLQSRPMFLETGAKFVIDWQAVAVIGGVAMALAAIASSLPALLIAGRHPADVIGRES